MSEHGHGHGHGPAHGHGHGPGHGHDHGPTHGHGPAVGQDAAPAGNALGPHGNPADLDAYVARLEDPERLAWLRPDELVEALALRSGQTVVEVGPGSGVFTRRLAAAVGAGGRVFAVDVEARLLEVLRERLVQAGLRQVTPVLGLVDDPLLPEATADLALLVNAYHHLADGPAYLARLRRTLAPGGRLAVVDFHRRELPIGPPLEQLIERADVVAHAAAAGLRLVAEHDFLPHQYFLVFG